MESNSRKDEPEASEYELHNKGVYEQWGIKMGRDKLNSLLQSALLKKRWYPKDTSKYKTKEKQQQNKQLP